MRFLGADEFTLEGFETALFNLRVYYLDCGDLDFWWGYDDVSQSLESLKGMRDTHCAEAICSLGITIHGFA